MVATFVAVAPERRSVGIGRALTQQNVHALVVQGALNARARMAQDEDTAAKMEGGKIHDPSRDFPEGPDAQRAASDANPA
jgi:hypothetical protein